MKKTIQPKEIKEILDEIAKLEIQHQGVQNTQFGTEAGRIKLNALNSAIGSREAKVRQMLNEKYNLAEGDQIFKSGKLFKIFRSYDEYGKEQRFEQYLIAPLVKLGFLKLVVKQGVFHPQNTYEVTGSCTYGLKAEK